MILRDVTLLHPEGIFVSSSLEADGPHLSQIELGEQLQADADIYGLVVMPGIIDLHGDMLERELEPRPGSRFPAALAIRELDKRHAAAGITTAYVALSFANFSQQDDTTLVSQTRDLITAVHDLKPKLGCDTRIHARFEIAYVQAKPVLKDLIKNKQVNLVSLMDHSPGQGQFRDLESYVSYMAQWLQVDRQQAEKEVTAQLENPAIWDNVHDVSELAQQHHLPLASHDDDTADKITLMQSMGVGISEFPVTLEAARAAKTQGLWTVMGAPNALRGGSHSGNLSAVDALKKDVLDALASDYYPAALLQAAFVLAKQGILNLEDSIKLITQNPADAAGLRDRGRLSVGLRADVVVLEYYPHQLPHVVATFREGKLIYWSGEHATVLGLDG
ncbi:MAG: alpha-D-ribose 1-methylphosphonate 5-triphosphate diphosphatase [Deinococcota bacterium]